MEERQFYAGRWRTPQQIEAVKNKRRERAVDGWSGQRVEQGIWRTNSNRFYVQVSVSNKNKKKTFDTIEEARVWRDEQRRSRPRRVYQSRGFRRFIPGSGVSTIHRSTWEPADYELDRQIIRDQLESANRVSVERDGMEFTVLELPYIAPVSPTDWTDVDAHRISTKRIKAAASVS